MIKWKTLCNKSCRYYFIESRTVEFVFFRFFYDFISILQVYCLMHPGRQDLNVIFFTFRSCRPLDGRQAPCRPLGGRQAPIFENFPIRHIFLKLERSNVARRAALLFPPSSTLHLVHPPFQLQTRTTNPKRAACAPSVQYSWAETHPLLGLCP